VIAEVDGNARQAHVLVMSSVGRWLPLIAACIGVWIVSSMSHPPVPAVFSFANADKLLHCAGYSVLGALAFYGMRGRGWPREALIAWVFVVLFGFSDEYHQSFVPGRDASLGDVAADAVGGAIGVGALAWWFSLRSKRQSAKTESEKPKPG